MPSNVQTVGFAMGRMMEMFSAGAPVPAFEPALARCFHPQVQAFEAESLPYGGVYRGVEGIRLLVERIGDTWLFDAGFVPGGENVAGDSRVIDGGDTVVVMGTFRARLRRNGRILAVPVAEFWSFDAQGQALTIRPYYFDTALIRDAFHAPA
ncbi:MAG: nuclear transport factor 2 family protein [Gammaproteobacteria bacterium]